MKDARSLLNKRYMLNLIVFILAFFFMEFIAWSSHKYVMHGFLWRWHKDHHRLDGKTYNPAQHADKKWEKNDYFFLIYATPAIILLIIGLISNYSVLSYAGAGIALYGLIYFVIHDIVIHQRLDIPLLQGKHSKYLSALIEAHKAHHHPKTREDFQNFGLLIFPRRYFKH